MLAIKALSYARRIHCLRLYHIYYNARIPKNLVIRLSLKQDSNILTESLISHFDIIRGEKLMTFNELKKILEKYHFLTEKNIFI